MYRHVFNASVYSIGPSGLGLFLFLFVIDGENSIECNSIGAGQC